MAVSTSWLLLPPVAYALHLRRRHTWRRSLISVLTRGEHEAYEWPTTAFAAIVVGIVIACVANTIIRVRRRQAILDQARPD